MVGTTPESIHVPMATPTVIKIKIAGMLLLIVDLKASSKSVHFMPRTNMAIRIVIIVVSSIGIWGDESMSSIPEIMLTIKINSGSRER